MERTFEGSADLWQCTAHRCVYRTGVGKTQLSLDIAEWLKSNTCGLPRQAEVVNADSMQVYRGQDIITNKASQDERDAVPHHLMDFLEIGQDYRVDRFRRDALQMVSLCHVSRAWFLLMFALD